MSNRIKPSTPIRLLTSLALAAAMLFGLSMNTADAQWRHRGHRHTLASHQVGNVWVGGEYQGYQWRFRFVRIGRSNQFYARWNHTIHRGFTSKVRIYRTRGTTKITVKRPITAGGVACTYQGRMYGNQVYGTYWCSNGYRGPWKATRY